MDAGDVRLRRATVADAEAISRVVVKALRETNAADYPPEIIEAIAANFAPGNVRSRFTDRAIFVALSRDRVIGTASLHRAAARTVFVDPEHQGKGVGAALMRAVERLAAAQGAAVLTVPSSVTAEGFYRKLGFVAVRDEYHGGERTIVMEKRLAP